MYIYRGENGGLVQCTSSYPTPSQHVNLRQADHVLPVPHKKVGGKICQFELQPFFEKGKFYFESLFGNLKGHKSFTGLNKKLICMCRRVLCI